MYPAPYSSRRGYTLIEVLVVVTVLGIATAVVAPSMLQAGTLGVQAAARIVVSDILYAQNEAVIQHKTRRVVFEPALDRYRVTDGNGTTLNSPLQGAGDGNYQISFADDPRFQGVAIVSADFNGSPTLEFDDLGTPASGGTVVLEFDGERYTVTVGAFTGASRLLFRKIDTRPRKGLFEVFGKSWRQTRCPIGIDLGSQSVKLLQLDTTGGLRAIAAASQQLDAGLRCDAPDYYQAVEIAVKEALAQAPFQGRTCVSVLPKAVVQCKNLRLPQMPDEELPTAVQWEARDRLRFSDNEMTVQYFDAGEVRQGADIRREAIVLAAATVQVERHLAMLTAAGLEPLAIDATPAAIGRLFNARESLDPDGPPRRRASDPAEAQLTLEIGRGDSTVLIAEGPEIRFYKPIPLGITSFERAISDALNVERDQAAELLALALNHELPLDDPEHTSTTEPAGAVQINAARKAVEPVVADLGRELSLCLRYFSVTFRGSRPTKAHLLGIQVSDLLASMLSPHAGLEVKASDPLLGIDMTEVRSALPRKMHSVWAVAAGLSLRGQKLPVTSPQKGDATNQRRTADDTSREAAA